MEEYNRIPQEEAKFNIGLTLLEGVYAKFTMYDKLLYNGELLGAKEILDQIYDEIAFSLKTDQHKEQKEIEEYINGKFNSTYISETNLGGQYRYPRERVEVRELLRIYVRALRRFMKEAGMLMPKKGEEGLF